MVVVQPWEIVALVIVAAGYAPLLVAARTRSHVGWFFTGYTFLFIGTIAAVLEGFFLPGVLNYVEHGVGVFLAAAAFLAAMHRDHAQLQRIVTDAAEREVETHD